MSDAVLAVEHFDGLSAKNKCVAIERFNSCDELFFAAADRDENLLTLIKPEWRSLASTMLSRQKLFTVKEQLMSRGIQYITKFDRHFPTLDDNECRILYLKGKTELLENRKVAVIGSRSATAYGREVAEYFASGLSEAGLTVLSGLADGVDSIAHRACVHSVASTIAVLGFGFDHVYPKSNASLMDEIAREGLLVSAYPPWAVPKPYCFAERNIVLAALSDAVVLIEAAKKSGSLITAASAEARGKKVFVVTGSIFSDKMSGSCRLIERHPECATVSVHAVLAHFGLKTGRSDRAVEIPVDVRLAELYEYIRGNRPDFNELVSCGKFAEDTLTEALFTLEMDGLIERYGNIYKERL